MHHRYRQRAVFLFSRLWNPYPSQGLRFPKVAQLLSQVKTLSRCETFNAIDTCCLLTLIVLGNPSYCQQSSIPGLEQQTLESVDQFDVSLLTGSVDPPLKLEYLDLNRFPGQLFPFISRLERRTHDLFTLLGLSTSRLQCVRRLISGITPSVRFLHNPNPILLPVGTYSKVRPSLERRMGVPTFQCLMIAVLRTPLWTGFIEGSYWSHLKMPASVSFAFWLRCVSFLFTASILRPLSRGFLAYPYTACLTGFQRKAFGYCRLTPLQALMASRKPGGYAVTPLPEGRDFHPYQTSVIKVLSLVLIPHNWFQRNVSHSNMLDNTP